MTSRLELLEVFPNPHPGRNYEIEIVSPEFTSVCPKTGQPDFGELTLTYLPGPSCLELKAFKIYLQSFRNAGIYYEDVTNVILAELAQVCQPKKMKLVARFTPRGGIRSTITAEIESSKL